MPMSRATMTGRGKWGWRLLKVLVSTAYLPNTLWQFRENQRRATVISRRRRKKNIPAVVRRDSR